MTLLKWNPSYALGIPSVDLEHREMIRMINQAYERIAGSADPGVIEACLENIYAGIAAHFALEERYMHRAGYTEYGSHKADHEDLLDQIRDMMDVHAEDPARGREMLRQELSNWFSRHFATFDARLHDSLGPVHHHDK